MNKNRHTAVRAATADDLSPIADIHVAAWHSAYKGLLHPDVLARATPATRLRSWRQWFSDPANSIAVLDEGDCIVGFTMTCAARPVLAPPRNYGELTHLYLDPPYQFKGHGHRLFEHASVSMREQGHAGMLLWTLEHNTTARAFYERHGMVADGARNDEPDWLGPGVFEVRYRLAFNR